MIHKPLSIEYNQYYQPYIALVTEDTLQEALACNAEELISFFKKIPPSQQDYRYEEGKWTVKEVLLHLIELERYMVFKAWVTARGDQATVLGHPDRELYLSQASMTNRSWENILEEFRVVRAATLILFENMQEKHSQRIGNHVRQAHALSARAIGFSIVGHGRHHLNVLKEKYLHKEFNAG